MEKTTQKEFEKSLREFMTELYQNRLKYEELAVDSKSKDNWPFFKGKAEAYGYAHNKLVNMFQWYGLKL